MSEMELGQIVDFVIEYNEMHNYEALDPDGKQPKGKAKRRKATQADWDALCG